MQDLFKSIRMWRSDGGVDEVLMARKIELALGVRRIRLCLFRESVQQNQSAFRRQ